MVINERDIRNETVRAAAQAVMAAARTAPKAKGRDMVEVAVVTEEDIERLAETMVSMSGESGMKFLLRDADNIRQAQAVIVVGISDPHAVCGLNCGYCGYPTCTAKPAQAPCMMNGVDVGIAIGSACAAATDMRVDTRVMFWQAGRHAACGCWAMPILYLPSRCRSRRRTHSSTASLRRRRTPRMRRRKNSWND